MNNKIKIPLITYCFFYNSIVFGASFDIDNEFYTQLETTIENVQNRIESSKSNCIQDTVIVIGPTRAGKSTLINFLDGKELKGKHVSGQFVLDNEDSSDEIIIKHGVRTGTLLPGSRYTQAPHNVLFWDCPGFGDVRGALADTINVVSIQQIYQNFSHLKILLVLSELNVLAGGAIVTNVFNQIAETFPDRVQLEQMLYLVITKKSTTSDPEIILNEYYEDQTNNLTTKGRIIVKYILDQRMRRIRHFSAPIQNGSYTVSNCNIWEMINQSTYVSSPQIQLAVPESAQAYLLKLETSLNKEIVNNITLSTQEFYNNLIDLIRGNVKTVSELREEFSKQLDSLHALKNITEEHIITFGEANIFSQTRRTLILSKIAQIQALKAIYSPISYKINDWFFALNDMIKLLLAVSEQPSIQFDRTSKTLQLSGVLLGVSDIRRFLAAQHYTDLLNVVNLFCWNTIFIDEDLTSPGALITILSPNWNIIGTRAFNLSGREGHSYTDTASAGTNGMPGKQGQNAGSVYGKGKHIVNLNQFNFLLNGGNGGRGQNGGKGHGGDLNSVTREEAYHDTYVGDIGHKYATRPDMRSWFNNDGVAQHEHKDIRGTKRFYNDSGKAGGLGGEGGVGGYCGIIQIDGGEVGHQNVHAVDGNRGIAGTGGEYGSNCHGVLLVSVKSPYEIWIPEHGFLGIRTGTRVEHHSVELPNRWIVTHGHSNRADKVQGLTPAAIQIPQVSISKSEQMNIYQSLRRNIIINNQYVNLLYEILN